MVQSRIPIALIYLTLGVLFLLLLLSYSNHQSNHSHSHSHSSSSSSSSHHHRRLRIRSPSSSPTAGHRPPIPFDPIISSIEQKREDRQWEKEHFHSDEAELEWEDLMDAEDYINDEERFNITHRIELLFPKIDIAPADSFVSLDELAKWNFQLALKEIMHRAARDMEMHDRNKDGLISLAEYDAPSWPRRCLDEENTSSNLGWWKEDHFNASDRDRNGFLNLTEFNDFLNPVDSDNPELVHWLCKEEIRERDSDKDGKLDFQEFFSGLFDLLQNHGEIHNESETSETAAAHKLFKDLDQNNDGFLSEDEIKPIIGDIHPSERFYAKEQADYLLSQADTDKDGRLTLDEMIEHPYTFYSSIFSDDDDGDDDIHDEFR